MAAGDLVDINTAIAWLGVSDTSPIMPLLISSVSTKIQRFIGYSVLLASYTRTFNGRGGRTLFLPDRPVMSVTAVNVDGVAIPRSTGVFAAGFVSSDQAVFLREFEFCRGVQNVTVSYSAGLSSVPADLREAALLWMSTAFAMIGENPSVSSQRAGDTEIDYAAAVTEVESATILMPPAVAATLQAYQRVAT